LDKNPTVIRADYSAVDPYVPKSAFDILQEGPVKAKDVDIVVLSHMHFDHSGDVAEFPQAQVLVGPGTIDCISPGYPTDEASPFDGTILSHAGLTELKESQYQKIGAGTVPTDFPFEKGVNLFGDGSLWILDAPGHMPGHQMALARTGQNEWVSMGGDCCHHRALLDDPRRDISIDIGPNGQPGFHKDPEKARETIRKLQSLHSNVSVFVALAHDAQIDGIVPLYPKSLNGWFKNGLKRQVREKPLTLGEVKTRYY
jgi:glyoxylase-like metal-dependent hydrolase (beta-lactamase superfamily II)